MRPYPILRRERFVIRPCQQVFVAGKAPLKIADSVVQQPIEILRWNALRFCFQKTHPVETTVGT